MTLDHKHWPAPQLIPADVLDGLARRLSDTKIPAAKLPEIIELRAIGRSLLGHIRHLEGARQTS